MPPRDDPADICCLRQSPNRALDYAQGDICESLNDDAFKTRIPKLVGLLSRPQQEAAGPGW